MKVDLTLEEIESIMEGLEVIGDARGELAQKLTEAHRDIIFSSPSD